MAYFPNKAMPKMLRAETSSEVDGSPLILNARDYNVHEREIASIEALLIGNGSNPSLIQVATQLQNQAESLINGNLISRHNGTVPLGAVIPMPPGVVSSSATGFLSSVATTITAASTEGFPSSGYLTKFNNNAGVVTQATDQETIHYTSKTSSTFTGCTRGVNGTTAQDGTNAVIVSGTACVSLSLKLNPAASLSFGITHTEALVVVGNAGPFGGGTIAVNYSLIVVGAIEAIDVSQIFGLG